MTKRSPALRTLEHLAEYSPRHAAALRALNSAEAENRRQCRIMEWCTEVFTGRGSNRHRPTEVRDDGRALVNEQWDPAEHPRAPKGQPDGGQWIGKGDSIGLIGGFDHGAMGNAPETRVERPDLLIAAGMGHHWGPLAAGKAFRSRLSKRARSYLVGAYSGATEPRHGFGPVNGVPHSKYNAEVKKELGRFIDMRVGPKGKLDEFQMEEFIDLIENGRGADGKPNKTIMKFNIGIKRMVKGGFKPRPSIEEVIRLGKNAPRTRDSGISWPAERLPLLSVSCCCGTPRSRKSPRKLLICARHSMRCVAAS